MKRVPSLSKQRLRAIRRELRLNTSTITITRAATLVGVDTNAASILLRDLVAMKHVRVVNKTAAKNGRLSVLNYGLTDSYLRNFAAIDGPEVVPDAPVAAPPEPVSQAPKYTRIQRLAQWFFGAAA